MNEPTRTLWVDAATELGRSFSERAAALDSTASFATQNFLDLKDRRFFSAGVPAELGGGGAPHQELCEVVRELAHHCSSTALAFSMHTHLVAAAVWRHRHGLPGAPLLTRVAELELALVSTGAGDWLTSSGKATRVEGGYRVTARKPFASGAPGGDIALTSAVHDDPIAGSEVIHFALPLRSPGVRLAGDWDTLGMRGTGSDTLLIEDAFVPDAAVTMRRPCGQWTPAFDVICTVATPIYIAAYVGLAESAAALARADARRRCSDPHLPYLVGEMENALATAQMAWREMVGLARGYDFEPDAERSNAALVRKTIATDAVLHCLDKAIAVVGGSAFYRRNPLEKLWRDAQAVQFHPLPGIKQVWLTGRLAMGLPHV